MRLLLHCPQETGQAGLDVEQTLRIQKGLVES